VLQVRQARQVLQGQPEPEPLLELGLGQLLAQPE
jgi:hypothetical protein